MLLNLEGVLTALLAWFVFRENFDRRIALGMAAIASGGVLLSWEGRPETGLPWGGFAIVGACLAWGIDNNLTRKVSAGDPVQIAATKGLVAGTVNLGIALGRGAEVDGAGIILACGALGLLGYGISLTFSCSHCDRSARTGAYFSVAPFVGAVISIPLLWEMPTLGFFAAAALMALGVWLHLTERHKHGHAHEPLQHDHLHVHDDHHRHEHTADDPPGEPHSHPHRHEAQRHSHAHYPDIHHRHDH